MRELHSRYFDSKVAVNLSPPLLRDGTLRSILSFRHADHNSQSGPREKPAPEGLSVFQSVQLVSLEKKGAFAEFYDERC